MQVYEAICELRNFESWLEDQVCSGELRSTMQVQVERYCSATSVLDHTSV